VEDRVSNDIGTKEPLKEWASINWKLIKKRVRNLRQRIYRAAHNGQWNKVKSLMKLMLRSYSNLLLSDALQSLKKTKGNRRLALMVRRL
jgi:RNA-directed DNA polymerase